ncbi:unnamed protein product [Cladocopium goreaui]|uniref:Nephrocystin-3 n=1 Tax=Cladocopium goreaui TaxID=2562237 RepID=A0A9P1FUM8_9DINO|nr:unnamed protein product [Cladocopium goreaui]
MGRRSLIWGSLLLVLAFCWQRTFGFAWVLLRGASSRSRSPGKCTQLRCQGDRPSKPSMDYPPPAASIAWPRYLSWLGFTVGALSGLRRKLFGGAQAVALDPALPLAVRLQLINSRRDLRSKAQLAPRSFRQMLRNSADTLEEVPALLVTVAVLAGNMLAPKQGLTDFRQLGEAEALLFTAGKLHLGMQPETSGKMRLLGGDFLYAEGQWMLAELGSLPVIRLTSRMIQDVSDGSSKGGAAPADMETEPSVGQVGAKAALHAAYVRVGCYFSAVASGAAWLSGAAKPVVKALRKYGTNLGTALQLAQFRDDAASQDAALWLARSAQEKLRGSIMGHLQGSAALKGMRRLAHRVERSCAHNLQELLRKPENAAIKGLTFSDVDSMEQMLEDLYLRPDESSGGRFELKGMGFRRDQVSDEGLQWLIARGLADDALPASKEPAPSWPPEGPKAALQFASKCVGKELVAVNGNLDGERLSQPASSDLVREEVVRLFKSGGKRLRPVLTLLTARATGATEAAMADVVSLAAAVEVLHSASLVHDDILDEADTRRGEQAAHVRLGERAAALVGDFLWPGRTVAGQIVEKFREIRALAAQREDQEKVDMWEDAGMIRKLAKEIQTLLGTAAGHGQRYPEMQAGGGLLDVFAAAHDCAKEMASLDAKPRWRSACGKIVEASRRAEQFLQPLLWMEVFPEQLGADATESVAFTHPTAQSHPQAPLEGSATAVTQSVAAETRTQGEAQAEDFPDENSGGGNEAKIQNLEHKLLELKNKRSHEDHPNIAATLHELGVVSCQAGDLKGAKQQLEESLRMKRSLHGDKDHPDIAGTLHELGMVSVEAGDFKGAKQQLEESLRMKRSLHGDKDHPDIAGTLHSLSMVSVEAGDLTSAKQQLEESLRVERSLHGDKDHPDIAGTLRQLGVVSRWAGDLEGAKQQLEESLRMERSLHGDKDHPYIAATLHELGVVSCQAGDLEGAKQLLEESLRMKRSLHGDKDHPYIAATLHELGVVSCQAGDLEGAKQLLEESLRMKRSLHGDKDHPGIAATLHELGLVSCWAGDLKGAKQQLEESLRMERSLHGDEDHPDIAVTLRQLGVVSRRAGDLKEAKQQLEESLPMKRSLHGDKDHPGIAATLHELGVVSCQAGDLEGAKQLLEESLRMERSLHGDKDHPYIAATLHELGVVSCQAGDLEGAKQQLEESLRMKRSLHGDKDHPGIAATLHELGLVSCWAGDLKGAKQQLEESLRMERSLHGDKDHPAIAVTLHELGVVSRRAGDLEEAKQQLEEDSSGGICMLP